MTLQETFCVFPADVLAENFIPFLKSPADAADAPALCGNPGGNRYGSEATLKRAIAAGNFPKLFKIKGRLYARKSDLAAYDAAILAKLNDKAVA